MNKAADLQYLKTQRGAEIRAGLQGYTGHLSKAELARRRNLSMRMRHLRQQFSVAPVRYLVTPVC